MTDWKEMYLESARAMERAIRVLIQAQRTCETIYMEDGPQEAGTEGGKQEKILQFPENNI